MSEILSNVGALHYFNMIGDYHRKMFFIETDYLIKSNRISIIVITSNVDTMFEKNGFEKERIF